MSKLSRLSAENIEDDILRAHFFAKVLEYVNRSGNTEQFVYIIRLDETYRADLASYRAYGTVELDWLVSLVCDVDDPMNPLPVGQTIKLPPAAWVRRSMRQFMDEMGL
ncbi:hypothetical protein ACSVUS_004550 [Vibrio alginolyticus]|nr:baseplate protein [Vibrio alginolyticus]EGR0148595.1 baseplate protein [Vibrio alginolyticus]EHA1078273.1 baseplate protein [Vibrio alginolyticus]EHA1136714.1 baseplate protein [Vibrio alginolyticus]EII5415927.1 hypothetical protein [Vibrio alginolyticus]